MSLIRRFTVAILTVVVVTAIALISISTRTRITLSSRASSSYSSASSSSYYWSSVRQQQQHIISNAAAAAAAASSKESILAMCGSSRERMCFSVLQWRVITSIRSRSSCQAYEFSPEISGSSCPGQLQVFSDPAKLDKLYWKSSYQNPGHMVWGVPSKPWFNPLENDICCCLEENYGKIRLELDRVLEARKEFNTLISPIGSREGEASLVSKGGKWSDYILLDDGSGPTKTMTTGKYSPKDLCPYTVNMLEGMEEVSNAVSKSKIGVAMFSCLSPGTYLKPHCGPINIRLTCHLGLIIPENVNIRVGDEWRTWEEGKCLLFDDSFEHEVKHDGDSERIVLLMNLWHPTIRKENWDSLAFQARQARQTRNELQEYFERQSARSNKRLN